MSELFDRIRSFFQSGRLRDLILRATGGRFAVKVIGAGLAFATEIALAHLLGVEEYGYYSYVWTWIFLLSIGGNLGFRKSLVKLVPEFQADEAWDELKGLLRWSTRTVLLFTVGLALGGGLVAGWLTRSNPPLRRVFYVGFVALPLLSLVFVREGGLRGLKNIVRAEIPYRILRPLLVIGGAGLLWFLRGELTAYTTMWVTVGALGVGFAVASYWLTLQSPDEVGAASLSYHGRSWLHETLPFLLISGTALLNNKTDILMLGILADTDAAGIYRATTRMTSLISYGLIAANGIVAPLISQFHSDDEHEKLQKMVSFATAGAAVFALGTTTVMIAFGETLLGLFGSEFTVGYTAMVILALGQLANNVIGLVGSVMTMSGRQWTATRVFGGAALANIVLNAILIPFFGMPGAAVASATTMVGWNSTLCWLSIRELDLNPSAFGIIRYLRSRN
ncbi:MAG: flippase [Bradymonadaceae bacterium]